MRKIIYANAEVIGLEILTKSYGLAGTVIKKFQYGEACTHCAGTYFSSDGYKVFEMKMGGLITTPLKKWIDNNLNNIVKISYPIVADFNTIKFNNIVIKDVSRGVRYDTGGLLYWAWVKLAFLNDPDSLFCSEQLGQYYRDAGHLICPDLKPRQQAPINHYKAIGITQVDYTNNIIKER